jgi:hypothetical protein
MIIFSPDQKAGANAERERPAPPVGPFDFVRF